MLFFPISTKETKAKLTELESESDIFPQNEGKVGKSELTTLVKALTNCALMAFHRTRRDNALLQQVYANASIMTKCASVLTSPGGG